MTMKRTELEKLKGKKIDGALGQSRNAQRYGQGVAQQVDRREQRKRDQALGLIAFAVKLDSALVNEVQALARQRDVALNELVAQLLRKGMESSQE